MSFWHSNGFPSESSIIPHKSKGIMWSSNNTLYFFGGEFNNLYFNDLWMYNDLYFCFEIMYNDTQVCSEHGSCIAPDQCICSIGYTGESCQYVLCQGKTNLDNSTCNAHGTCISPDICSFFEGYSYSSFNNYTYSLLPNLSFEDSLFEGTFPGLSIENSTFISNIANENGDSLNSMSNGVQQFGK